MTPVRPAAARSEKSPSAHIASALTLWAIRFGGSGEVATESVVLSA